MTQLFFETILILFAILASNGIIYSLTFFNLKKPNSSENISVITNSSEKDGLALTTLIASNHIRLTSSESSASETLSLTSSETNGTETLSLTSSETNGTETLSVPSSVTNGTETLSVPSSVTNGTETLSVNPLDSLTILDSQTFEQ
jgi:hypothetical protein